MIFENRASKPKILCLHGRGTSAMIFQIQTMQLVQLLEDRFDFLFVDAPLESEAGPGVLPVFEDEGPYFSWLQDISTNKPLSNSMEAAVRILDELEASRGSLAGILGFSQGAAVGLGLLLRDQRRREIGLSSAGYRFGAFVGGGMLPLPVGDDDYPNSVGSTPSSGTSTPPSDDEGYFPESVEVPTLHVTGSNDLWAKQGRALQTWVNNRHKAASLEFVGGHEMPRRSDDVARLAKEIVRMYEESSTQS